MAFGIKPSEGYHTGLSIFEEYPARASRLSGKERKNIKKTARSLFETSPSDAISYLAGQRGYTNFRPDSLMGKLMAKPVDYERFRPIGAAAFQDLLGREISDTEWQQTSDYAKSLGVRDPNAFQSLLTQQISLQNPNKILTEADRAWQAMYGNIERDAEGNLLRGRVAFDPGKVNTMVNSMLGTVA